MKCVRTVYSNALTTKQISTIIIYAHFKHILIYMIYKIDQVVINAILIHINHMSNHMLYKLYMHLIMIILYYIILNLDVTYNLI